MPAFFSFAIFAQRKMEQNKMNGKMRKSGSKMQLPQNGIDNCNNNIKAKNSKAIPAWFTIIYYTAILAVFAVIALVVRLLELV